MCNLLWTALFKQLFCILIHLTNPDKSSWGFMPLSDFSCSCSWACLQIPFPHRHTHWINIGGQSLLLQWQNHKSPDHLMCHFILLDPDIWSSGGAVGLPACQRGRVRASSCLYICFVQAPGKFVCWQGISNINERYQHLQFVVSNFKCLKCEKLAVQDLHMDLLFIRKYDLWLWNVCLCT